MLLRDHDVRWCQEQELLFTVAEQLKRLRADGKETLYLVICDPGNHMFSGDA